MRTYFLRMLAGVYLLAGIPSFGQTVSIGSLTGYPFPSELCAATTGSRIALAVNERGLRNIYVAEGPAFHLRKLTDYNKDEGQEITGIRLSADGKWVVYVRGGDHGAFEGNIARNPSSGPYVPKVQVMSIPFGGGKPTTLDIGDDAVISPDGTRVAFIKNDQVWISPVDGSGPARQLFYARGRSSGIEWSPDGRRIVFVSSRGDHSLVGVFTDSTSPVLWLSPSFSRDQSPHWSPDGRRVVFVRRPASGGAPDSLTVEHWTPWALWVAETETGNAKLLWKAPETPQGSLPATQGGTNVHWAGDRIVFVSYQDGWPHIYSIAASGGESVLLTKGGFGVEHIQLSPDARWLVFSANSGLTDDDLDRRHVFRVPVDRPAMELLTPGKGIESFPVVTGDGANIVLLSATAQRPAVPAVLSFTGGKPATDLRDAAKLRLIGEELIPAGFPVSQLVEPRAVRFRAADGKPVYGQLFEPGIDAAGSAIHGKRPAILFVHGGPERQMLLGWHYGDYYSNTYAINQYLVSRGFIVLSVNYRLGIGYGFDFLHPEHAGMYGASEYLDVKAAGSWLAAQPGVDASRIGIYGGSYGGLLTALALGHDSKLFAAGVDIHGVHDFTKRGPDDKGEQAPDTELARQLAWKSSPISLVDTWTSPVLFIHGDDDGNVEFHQSVDLIRRFEKKGMPFESLMIPDDTHHWLKYSHQVKVDSAIAEFLERKLITGKGVVTGVNVNGPRKWHKGLSGKVVCIDPGHGGTAATDHYRQGPTGEREEWINLRVALLLKKMLEERGAKVILARKADEQVPLADRAAMAVSGNADVFLSIHHNATADSTVNFPIIYFHGSASENLAGVALGRLLARSLEKDLYSGKTPVSLNSDYTIFPANGASVLRNSYGIPGLLAEASFFTNPSEEGRLKQEVYNTREAKAYLSALEDFFSSAPLPVNPNRIAVGLLPFTVLEEADRMDPAAREWYRDFQKGSAEKNSADTAVLRHAYDLLTRSARSFPDSYVAGECQLYRAEILEKLNRPEEARQERIRATEFYLKVDKY